MTLQSYETGFTASSMYRLVHACEVYLGNTDLADRLRTLAAQVESSPYISQEPELPEAAALASALNRFIGTIRHISPEKHDAQVTLELRGLLQEAEVALALSERRELARRVAGLYVIVDPELTMGRDVQEVTLAALRGGAKAIQYRDKLRNKGDQLPIAHALRDLCNQHSASFIINDHADLAAASGAHGLHVGQHDLSVLEARRVVYPTQFVGTSNATPEEVQDSLDHGVDYMAVGTMFSTDSKAQTRLVGLKRLKRIRSLVTDISLVAIGGITLDNVGQVLKAGADGICVISAVCSADDPEAAARALVQRIAAHTAGDTGASA